MTTGIDRCIHSLSALGVPERIRDGLAKPWNHRTLRAHATLTFSMTSRLPPNPRTIATRSQAGSSVFDARRTGKSP
jgi:hypothetical protein